MKLEMDAGIGNAVKFDSLVIDKEDEDKADITGAVVAIILKLSSAKSEAPRQCSSSGCCAWTCPAATISRSRRRGTGAAEGDSTGFANTN